MNYLLDTHALIWSIIDPKKLSKSVINIIEDPANSIVVSAVSFWEISLKASIGKLEIEGFLIDELPELCLRTGFDLISFTPADAASSNKFPLNANHKDPFDRMLIWQALQQKLVLITNHSKINNYHHLGLKTLW